MTTDKTGAATSVSREADRFTIAVEGKDVGFTEFADRDGTRVFFHTEVDDEYGGRGLATILVSQALAETKDAGLRIVPVCTLVAAYADKHTEFTEVVDPTTREIEEWLKRR